MGPTASRSPWRSEPDTVDVLALGEVMLRLDPGDLPVRAARRFEVSAGGGEYNVVRGLSSCFGLRTGVVSALGDNDLGLLLRDLIREGGVDTDLVVWRPTDGRGTYARNGLNFTERGFGVRPARGLYDRAHSAASALTPSDFDWTAIFAERRVRWFHTGGVFASLTDGTAGIAADAMRSAAEHGATVSFDVNYRPSLWNDRGGAAAARVVMAGLIGLADVLIGSDGLGREGETLDAQIERTAAGFPNLRLIANTSRTAESASRNRWEAAAWCRSAGLVNRVYEQPLEVLDRVGSGDAFAAGLIFGQLDGRDVAESLQLAVAHGALVMTTPGDTSMATLSEVEALASGTSRSIIR